MPQSDWSEVRVRAMLAEHTFGYQNVELPYGLETGGKDRSHTARLIFPKDLTGKTVLDVGCMYGYFGFEAERRGAKHFVGADVDPENIRKCRLLADCLGSKGEFLHFDIEKDQIPGRFDTVLCLNILHHLRNPLSALDKLIEATRETLVLEVASFGPRDRRKNRVPRLLGSFLNRLPIMYLAGANRRSRGSKQTVFITPKAVEAVLVRHRRTFARADLLAQGHKGRFIMVARKRRIGHLFVVAGAPAGGKSTLIENLGNNAIPSIAERIGFDPSLTWQLQRYGDLDRATEPEVPNMILHYNITQHMIDGALHFHNRGVLDLMKVAERVSVATVWCPAPRLLSQYTNERLPNLEGRSRSPRKRRKARKFLELYRDPDRLAAMFRDWFAFVEHHTNGGSIVGYDDEYWLSTLEEWERAVRD